MMDDSDASLYSSRVVLGCRLLTSLAVAGMGILLNSVTIVVLSRSENNCFGEITTIFIRALAWKDLFSAIQLLATEVAILLTPLPEVWPELCVLLIPVFYTGINLSSLFLCCLSVDRYVAVTYPLRYPIVLTKRIAVSMLLFAGHVGIASCLMLFAYHHLKYGQIYFDFGIYFCQTDLSPQFQDPVWIAISLFGFLVPSVSFLLITAVNVKLFTTAFGHVKRQNQVAASLQNGDHGPPEGGQLTRLMEMKALRSLLLITVCFYVSYVPIFVDSILQFLVSSHPSSVRFLITYYVTYSNCWISCLIYVFMYRQFLADAKRYLNSWARKLPFPVARQQ